jgi:carboxyvinyl-carboxyphosphonate phosphorylmutase
MIPFRDRRMKLRAVLDGDRCINPGSVFDPLSMRIAEAVGFEVGMLGGSVASMAVLGAPDVMVVTLTEFAEQCRRMTRVSDLPLLVDADHGFGGALNARRTVEELEVAGVAGMTLEDTELPTAYGANGAARLVSLEEHAAKIRAAIDARMSPEMVIVGRTNLGLATPEESLDRLRAYEAAGADALFLMGVKTREQLDAAAEAVSLPLIMGSAPAAMADVDYLASRKVRVALRGHLPVQAAIKAMYDVQRTLMDGQQPPEAMLASKDLMRLVLGENDYDRWIKDFM